LIATRSHRRLKQALAALALALTFPNAAPAPLAVDDAALMAQAPAETLDAYHLFTDAGARVPNAALTPYVLNTPLFSDYAEKFRFVYLPPGKQAAYRADGVLDFPVGATLVKTFAYPADFRKPDEKVRYIETRLLIHKQDGWIALTYVWNDAQDSAVLKRAGVHADISFVNAKGETQRIDYHVPNVNQCKQCHSLNGEMTPIGPKARNLNRSFAFASGEENQLTHWMHNGILTGAPDPKTVVVLPKWDDPKASIEDRARAYLDVNCGHCHNRAGLASNSGLYLTYDEASPSALGINKRPIAAGIGSGNLPFAISPGEPERSILLYRMQSTEPGVMMPQIGRTLSDDEAVKLVRAYILSLKN
jgi:uncharacterized repeat protein (TIGR03806 family)